jgi:hypothetical protein
MLSLKQLFNFYGKMVNGRKLFQFATVRLISSLPIACAYVNEWFVKLCASLDVLQMHTNGLLPNVHIFS